MIVSILILLAGLALVVFGADWLVDGASGIARKAGISEFVIGLTIVGFGTSCPELVVSLTGAFQGNADISIGNVIGSNIFNTVLILGLTALISPVAITAGNRNRDIPIALLVTFLFVICGMNLSLLGVGETDAISRVEGIVFLVIFAIYLYVCFKYDTGSEEQDGSCAENVPLWKSAALSVLGIGGLIFGGTLFVNSATDIARAVGVSDKFIAITLLAGGTSLPELVTCIVAAVKHKEQLALGNILGSNVFNILLILGLSAIVTPLSFKSISQVDVGILLLSAVLVWLWTYTGKKDRIDRMEGLIMLLCYSAYMVWLFLSV